MHPDHQRHPGHPGPGEAERAVEDAYAQEQRDGLGCHHEPVRPAKPGISCSAPEVAAGSASGTSLADVARQAGSLRLQRALPKTTPRRPRGGSPRCGRVRRSRADLRERSQPMRRHTRISTDDQAWRDALTRLHDLLDADENWIRGRSRGAPPIGPADL